MMHRLAAVGEGQHAHQGLLDLLGTCGVPQQLTRCPGEMVTDMLLPSTWIKLLHAYPHEFRLRLGADSFRLARFWREFAARPLNFDAMRNHPALAGRSQQDLATVVPLCVHSDAAPYSKAASCTTISFSGLLGSGEEKFTKFVCASFLKSKDRGDRTDEVWRHLLDDLEALATGVVSGQPVVHDARGTVWRFALLYVKCDEEVRCNEFGLAHYSAADNVCSECFANRRATPFTDLRDNATWRQTEQMDLDTYKNRIRAPHHPLVSSPLFCHRSFFMMDLMHVVDCAGVANVVFGSVLVFLLADARLGPTKATRLERVNQLRVEHYDARPGSNRLPEIRATNVVADGWGNLHGPVFKAAIVRSAAPFFSELVHSFCVGNSSRDVCMRKVVSSFAEFYDLLYDGPMFLPQASMDRLRTVLLEFGLHFMRLRELARRSATLAWQVRPKVHKMQHMTLWAQSINPKYCQCYGEESCVGTVVKTWKGSVSGRYRGVVQRVVLVKRVTALLLRFELALLS